MVSPNISPSPTVSRFTPTLPTEIWKLIFRFATTTPDLDYTHHDSAYTPFQPTLVDQMDTVMDVSGPLLKANIRFKARLVFVCKHWKALASEFLYEDVRIQNSQQTRSFLDTLERSAKEMRSEGLGKYVRRLQLPPSNVNEDLSRPTDVRLVDIINCCTNLEILTKPPYHDGTDDLRFWWGLTTLAHDGRPKLASLKRLDWFAGFREENSPTEIQIQRLVDLIRESPNLRYLCLSGNPSNILLRIRPIPKLTTLRFGLIPTVDGISRHDVPELTTFIAHPSILYLKAPFLGLIGQQLHAIELTCHSQRSSVSTRDIEDFFKCCPNLLEFSFHLGFPHLSEIRSFQHLSITCIRLHVDRYPRVTLAKLPKQFGIVAGRSFPALKRVVLHGDWSLLRQEESFQTFRETLLNRGCVLEYVGWHDDDCVPAAGI